MAPSHTARRRNGVLVHSPRATGVASAAISPHLEFEDLIIEWGDAELISPAFRTRGAGLEPVHNRASKLARWPRRLNVAYDPIQPEADEYDLFFALLLGPDDVLAVNAIDRWRERCGVAVAWLVEAWEFELDNWKGHWDLLGEFDHIVVSMEPCRVPIEERTGTPVHVMPTATDALLFSPKRLQERPIDVMSIGRRSDVTHQRLIEMARCGDFFYHFDTLRQPRVKVHWEHRFQYASTVQRSKFFIANRSKIESVEGANQQEFGGRYFEAAAAGAIALGSFPDTDEFRAAFDWRDANVALPFDGDPAPVLAPWMEDPDRRFAAAARSIDNCLDRHDWVHRWSSILEIAGVEPSPGMAQREEALAARRTQLSGQ